MLLIIALLLQSRLELEQHSVDTASTSDAVTFITYVQTLKRKIKQFEKNVDVSTTIIYTISKLYLMFDYFYSQKSSTLPYYHHPCFLQIP